MRPASTVTVSQGFTDVFASTFEFSESGTGIIHPGLKEAIAAHVFFLMGKPGRLAPSGFYFSSRSLTDRHLSRTPPLMNLTRSEGYPSCCIRLLRVHQDRKTGQDTIIFPAGSARGFMGRAGGTKINGFLGVRGRAAIYILQVEVRNETVPACYSSSTSCAVPVSHLGRREVFGCKFSFGISSLFGYPDDIDVDDPNNCGAITRIITGAVDHRQCRVHWCGSSFWLETIITHVFQNRSVCTTRGTYAGPELDW